LRDRRQGDLENQFSEYYSDLQADLADSDESNDDNNARPTLFLAGPYHYELNLNNPELVKNLQLDVQFTRSVSNSEVTAVVSTDSTKRVQLLYSRLRQSTLKGLHGKLDISLTQLDTNDVRFSLQTEAVYQKLKVLKAHLEVTNKIIRPFHHKISFGRDARGMETDDNIVPKYHLDLLMDTSRGPRTYNLHFDVTPSDSDITSNFVVERSSPSTNNQNVRYINGDFSLIRNTESSDLEYSVELHTQNLMLQSQLDVTGTVLLAMFRSNIDLDIDYKSSRIQLPEPAKVQFGHEINLSEGAKSTIRAAVKHAYRNIDHSVLVTFKGDVAEKRLDLLTIDINRPGLKQPAQFFYEKNVSEDETNTESTVQFGARNMERDLSQSPLSFAQTLIKVDFDNTLRSLVVQYVRRHTKGRRIAHELLVKKNDKAFVTIKDEIYGEMSKVRENFNELAKTAFGASLYVKVMENSGAVSANLDLEASKSQGNHRAELTFKTENLFKILSRVASFNAKFVSTKSEFDAKFEMTRLGEVRSFKVFSTSGLKRNGNSATFNVGYEKRLANGKVLSAPGTASFTFNNFKNFETTVDVPSHYNHKLAVANSRDSTQTGLFAQHSFNFVNSHLDYDIVQNRFNLEIEDRKQSSGNRKFNFVIDARKGPLGQLDSTANLDILASVSTKNLIGQEQILSSVNSLALKSSRFNLNLAKTLNYNFEEQTGSHTLSTKTDLNLPAIITDPGKLNYVNHEAQITSTVSGNHFSVLNRFKTDSKLFGRLFRELNIDYKRDTSAEKQLTVDYTINYQLSKDAVVYSPLSGTQIDLTSCTLSEHLVHQKNEQVLNVDHSYKQTCAGQLVLEDNLTFRRNYDSEQRPSTRLSLDARSAVFPYPPVLVKAAHDKFHSRHGLVGLQLNVAGQDIFSNEFSYDRDLDSENQLKTAQYQTITSFGEQMRKSCSLNILNGVDYYNAFDCRLNTTKVPNMELNYGYKLRLANVADRAYGKRSGEFNVVVPGRTMRVEYNANYPAYFDGNDDDEDANNEREFNATSTLFWNYAKEPSKFIRVEAKRDNVAKGRSTTYVQFVNTPNFKVLKFSVDKVSLNANLFFNLSTKKEGFLIIIKSNLF